MLKKLRIKFIAAVLAALLAVLVIILGAVNIVNYTNVMNEADDIIYVLEYNGGSFESFTKKDLHGIPDADTEAYENMKHSDSSSEDGSDAVKESGKAGAWRGAPQPETDGGLPEDLPDDLPPDLPEDIEGDLPGDIPDERAERFLNGNNERGIRIGVETPYETRYFVVYLDSEKTVTSTYVEMISAVDDTSARELAQQVSASQKTAGNIGSYRYAMCENDDGYMIIFVDITSRMDSFRSFLLASIIIAAAGWLIMAVLVMILSGRIMKPFADNYEKQRRFITDAGHELKTPLAIIAADAEVLEMDVEEDNEWLSDIKSQVVRMTDLTNELITLSRMEESPDKAQMTSFSLSDVAEETVKPFTSRAIADGKSLVFEIQPMITVCAQEKAIRQLISILLDNACKYSLEGSEIRVSVTKTGRSAQIQVFNKCAPVSKESISHMFDRFYRADESRSSSTTGYGIGLAIARAIVTGHKGRISASSEDGNSLTITALIPTGV